MDATWKKLQATAIDNVLVLGAPPEAEALISAAEPVWELVRQEPNKPRRFDMLLLFVKTREEIDAATETIERRAHTADTGRETLVWICYPKKSSTRYRVAINRDSGWDSLLEAGWEGVRQIAIDHDWSALRFRRRDAISNYTRKRQIGR